MNQHYYKLTTQLPSKEMAEKLQAIAFELGYIQTRGNEAGKVGSISQLLEAIANGEVELVRLSTEMEQETEGGTSDN